MRSIRHPTTKSPGHKKKSDRLLTFVGSSWKPFLIKFIGYITFLGDLFTQLQGKAGYFFCLSPCCLRRCPCCTVFSRCIWVVYYFMLCLNVRASSTVYYHSFLLILTDDSSIVTFLVLLEEFCRKYCIPSAGTNLMARLWSVPPSPWVLCITH